tara:strand:- start:620 stop:946 length:327 start_codon:yes stop_codon:yes gene_type:complete
MILSDYYKVLGKFDKDTFICIDRTYCNFSNVEYKILELDHKECTVQITQKGLKTLFRNMPKDIYGGKNHLRGFIIDDIESRLLFSSDLNEDMDPLIYQQVYNKLEVNK